MAQIFLCAIFNLMLTLGWGFRNVLSMPEKDRVVQHNENINYTNILNFWNEHKREIVLHGEHKEVVLVMGNTGAGITTLISALIGKKLRVTKSKGYFLILDEEDRIGTSTLSKTLVPEIMIDDEKNVTYIDCPGFRNNRNIEYDISSLYFQKTLMDQVEKIKIILVINFDSLKVNGNRNDLDDLFEHVSEFAKTISKFHSGIALVATKVENTYEQYSDESFHLSNYNQLVLEEIADYLKSKQDAYRNKTDNLAKYTIFTNLIEVLLEKKNSSYSRIAIFRQPTRVGELKKMPETENEINVIAEMIIEKLHYVGKQKDEFGFALSKSSKNIVDQIVNDIFKNNLTNRLHKIGSEILLHFFQMGRHSYDIKILYKKIWNAYYQLLEIKNVEKLEILFEEFLKVANAFDIAVSQTNLENISTDIKALRFFTTVSNNNENIHMMSLKNQTQYIIDSMKNLKYIFKCFYYLDKHLAAYSSQKLKNDDRIEIIVESCTNSTYKVIQDIPHLENISKEIGSDKICRKIKTSTLNHFQLRILKAIFNTFRKKLEFSCSSSSQLMIVKGYNIRISDLVELNCWKQAKRIQISALNKVFIDWTINKTGAEGKLFILAPTWEIVDEPKIILDGKAGEPHENATAKSASSNLENGKNGLPGFPGGPAGTFFGVGKKFINLKHLEIHANGGKGGPGQHGGNGADGISGEELSDWFFKTSQGPEDIRKYFDEHQYVYNLSQYRAKRSPKALNIAAAYGMPRWSEYTIDVLGKPAKKPTNGGDGGAGGRGGDSGKIIIIGLGNVVNVKTSNNSGSTGLEGQGGHGGKETSEGRRVKFQYSYGGGFFYMGHTADYSDIEWTHGDKVPAGRDGMPGNNKKNQEYSIPTTPINSCSAINSFKNFVITNLHRNIKESELRTFIYELEHDNQIKTEYNTLAFVEEFKRLENRFRELRHKIDFVPLYKSLFDRIEEYTKSEKISSHKKVLSYISTAALTKLFMLNHERKGRPNSSKNLYLVESNIEEIDEFYHKYQNKYSDVLNKKMRIANDFIQVKLKPEIDKFWDKSENQTKTINNEIDENKSSGNNTFETREKNRERLRDIMLLRVTLLPLKLATSALSFFERIGAKMVVAVMPTTRLEKRTFFDKTSSLSGNNKHNFSAALVKLDHYENKSLQKLKDIEKIAKKMILFTNLEINSLNGKTEEVNDVERDTKYEKRLPLLNAVQSMLNSAVIVYGFAKKFANDEKIMSNINNQMSECIQQLKLLENIESQAYDLILYDFHQIKELMNVVQSSVNGSSHAELDLTKWNIRINVKDVKLLLQEFTCKMSSELQSNSQRYMKTIGEGFSILIDIYDRIDFYLDIVKQADYIARIKSPSMTNIQVTDTEISKSMNDMKLIIHSNILTEQYEIALHTFKQYYFPFGAHVLQKYQLPADMKLNDIKKLESKINDRIDDIKNHINENKSMIDKYSKYIHKKKVFNSNTEGSSPFYVWKYDTIKDEIQQLLNGSEIIVKADISQGLFYNAIKYSDIGINLKFNNKSLQSSFTSVLRYFRLTMTTIGLNYYRCGERYYSISFDDDISISYTLTQDKNKNWLDPNKVYTTIFNGRTFLSPYVMWSIKLNSVDEFVSFDHLNSYANEIMDLELVGQGDYIEQDDDFNFKICNEYLNTLYNNENIVNERFLNVGNLAEE